MVRYYRHHLKIDFGTKWPPTFLRKQKQKNQAQVLGFKVTFYNESWSGQRESNPHYQLGRLQPYPIQITVK